VYTRIDSQLEQVQDIQFIRMTKAVSRRQNMDMCHFYKCRRKRSRPVKAILKCKVVHVADALPSALAASVTAATVTATAAASATVTATAAAAATAAARHRAPKLPLQKRKALLRKRAHTGAVVPAAAATAAVETAVPVATIIAPTVTIAAANASVSYQVFAPSVSECQLLLAALSRAGILSVGGKVVTGFEGRVVHFQDGTSGGMDTCIGQCAFRIVNPQAYLRLRAEYCPVAPAYQHAAASNRSLFWAEKVAQWVPDGSIVTLDARLRNCWHLTEQGVESRRIYVVEFNAVVALFQSLLVCVLYDAGCYPQVVLSDIMAYLQQPHIGPSIHALYLDLCGKIPTAMPSVVESLTSLKMYGVTQGKRTPNVGTRFLRDFVAPKDFVMLQEFPQRSVDCRFYAHVNLPLKCRDCSTFSFLIDRIVDVVVDDESGILYATVVWYWYTRDGTWSTTNESASRIPPEFLTEYFTAQACYPRALDPVLTFRQHRKRLS
jgi:hypothetical protein